MSTLRRKPAWHLPTWAERPQGTSRTRRFPLEPGHHDARPVAPGRSEAQPRQDARHGAPKAEQICAAALPLRRSLREAPPPDGGSRRQPRAGKPYEDAPAKQQTTRPPQGRRQVKP